MSKHIGIIYEVIHPLLEKISERLKQQSCEVTFIHYRTLALVPNKEHPFKNFSSVYLDRMGEKDRSYATQLELLQHLSSRMPGVPVTNCPKAYAVARNKALMAQTLAGGNIKIPQTGIIYLENQIQIFSEKNPSELYVVKSTLGCCGDDIHIISSDGRPEGVRKVFERDGMAVIQPFIMNSKRFIWRIDVVDGQVIVCNRRFAYNSLSESPICNGTLGGAIEFLSPENLPSVVRETAKSAVHALGLKVAGVDLIEDDDGVLYVIEVNPEPDITMDRYDFPYAIADYLRSL